MLIFTICSIIVLSWTTGSHFESVRTGRFSRVPFAEQGSIKKVSILSKLCLYLKLGSWVKFIIFMQLQPYTRFSKSNTLKSEWCVPWSFIPSLHSYRSSQTYDLTQRLCTFYILQLHFYILQTYLLKTKLNFKYDTLSNLCDKYFKRKMFNNIILEF